MQTFQTAAVVGLIDNMSGPLKELAKNAKALAKSFEGGKILDGNQFNNYTAGLNKANAAAREHLTLMQKIGRASRTAIPVAAPIVPFVKTSLPEEKATQDTMSRMRDLNGVDPQTVHSLRELARNRGVKYAGGQGVFLKEAESGAKMNIPNELLGITAEIGQQFADFLHEQGGEGIEKAINTAEYFSMLKNRAGEKTSPKALYEEHLANGMSEEDAKLDIARRLKAATGMYKRIANMMPGSEAELFEALKMSAPTAETLGIPLKDTVATLSMLATGGLTGSHAGTLYRGMLTRAGNPSFVAMAAARTAGYDLRQNMKLNANFMNEDAFVDGLAQYYGPKLNSDPKLKAKLKKRIADFKASPESYKADGEGNYLAYNDLQKDLTQMIVAAYGKNKKGLDAVNSELVSKRIAKGLNLSNTGFDLLGLVKELKAQGLLTPGLIKALVGTEAGTAMGQLSLQDVAKAQQVGEETTRGDKYTLSQEWDAAMKARADSIYGTWEGIGNRVKALFDKMFESVEKPLDATGKKLNETADKAMTADTGKTRALTAGVGGLAALGGAGGLSFLGGSVAAAGAASLATGGSALLLGAAGYLAYRGLTDPDNVKEGSVEDIRRRRRFGNPFMDPRIADTAQDPRDGWVIPKWEPPAQWPPKGSEPFLPTPSPGGGQQQVSVTGDVTGSAELHANVAVELQPSAYFLSLVKRVEALSTIQLNGKLGTSMAGSDNSPKPSVGPPLKTGGGS